MTHTETMTSLNRRVRWLAPLTAAVLLGAGGSAVGVISAAARSGLPHRSAAELLVDVQKARLDGLSGTIVQNADLGLPSLPGVGGSGSSNMTSLISGSHTLRLWYSGPDHVRLALLGTLGESDLVRNGNDLWTWSSSDRSATHRTLPPGRGHEPQGLASGSAMTPQRAADAALHAITPSTKVATDGTAVVAGRSAYELLLTPRDTGSLVGSVRIAVDAKTHVPTRVRVFAKNATKPALEVGFTSFDPTAPAASAFRFNPPPGTKVTQAGGHRHPMVGAHRSPLTRGHAAHRLAKNDKGHALLGAKALQAPRVVGTGWTSVVVTSLPRGALAGSGSTAKPMLSMLRMLPKVSGTWGSGHLVHGSLFSALLTDDGRVAVGAVSPDALYAALARR